MDEEQKRTTLIQKIESRRAYDDKWASRDFTLAQTVLWMAILCSFFTAILAAGDAVPKLLLGFLTAIPGTAILIDKNFSFARRARWHWDMVAKLDQFANQLQFEGAKVEEVSKQLGEFRVQMEANFPDMKTEGFPEKLQTSK